MNKLIIFWLHTAKFHLALRSPIQPWLNCIISIYMTVGLRWILSLALHQLLAPDNLEVRFPKQAFVSSLVSVMSCHRCVMEREENMGRTYFRFSRASELDTWFEVLNNNDKGTNLRLHVPPECALPFNATLISFLLLNEILVPFKIIRIQ